MISGDCVSEWKTGMGRFRALQSTCEASTDRHSQKMTVVVVVGVHGPLHCRCYLRLHGIFNGPLSNDILRGGGKWREKVVAIDNKISNKDTLIFFIMSHYGGEPFCCVCLSRCPSPPSHSSAVNKSTAFLLHSSLFRVVSFVLQHSLSTLSSYRHCFLDITIVYVWHHECIGMLGRRWQGIQKTSSPSTVALLRSRFIQNISNPINVGTGDGGRNRALQNKCSYLFAITITGNDFDHSPVSHVCCRTWHAMELYRIALLDVDSVRISKLPL